MERGSWPSRSLPWRSTAHSGEVRPREGRKRSPAPESACGGVSSQQGQQSLGFAGCGGRQSRSDRESRVSVPAAAPLANASSTHCRALSLQARQDLAGLMARWPTQAGRVGVVVGGVRRGPAARDARDGRLLRLWRPPQPDHPVRLRSGKGCESHGRKPAHQVSPLATCSQRHAKLTRTHFSVRTPCHDTQ